MRTIDISPASIAASALAIDPHKIEIIEKLPGGMSNLVYKMRIDNQFYTLRIPGVGACLFIDRRHEKIALDQAARLDLLPPYRYFDIKTGVKIAPFIEGEVLTKTDIAPYLEKIANTLKILHRSNIEGLPTYDHLGRLERYESYNSEQNPQYLELKKQWTKLYEEKYSNDPLVFAHGDAQRSNFVVNAEHTLLFDYEFAGLNSIYFDIASFANVSFDDALKLLAVYLERVPTTEEENHVRFYRIFQTLQWHQVALKKDAIGLGKDLGLDFAALANKYLSWAQQLYNDYQLG